MFHSIDSTNPDRNQCRSVRTSTEKLVKACSDLIKLGSPAVQQEAFVILCDILIVFGKQLGSQGKRVQYIFSTLQYIIWDGLLKYTEFPVVVGDLGSLIYIPDTSLHTSLCEYIIERVFSDTEMEEEPTSDEEAFAQAEKLNDRRILLAGYLKLVVYSVLDTTSSVSVLAQYLKV